MSDEHIKVLTKMRRSPYASTKAKAALDAAIAALGGGRMYGWAAPATGQFFKPSEVAATERTRELIAQGELVRVYALPAAPSKEGV